MFYIHPFVSEVSIYLINLPHSADKQSFEITFGGDPHIKSHVQSVVVSDERSCRRTAHKWMHHRCLNFKKTSRIHIVSDKRDYFYPFFESLSHIIVHYQIEISLAVTHFLICKSMKFFRKRADIFCKQLCFVCKDRKFTGTGDIGFTFNPDNVPHIIRFFEFVKVIFEKILCENYLQSPCFVLYIGKSKFAHHPQKHYSSRN